MKICNKCQLEKSLDCFYKDKATKDGLYSMCKECKNELRKQHYKNNREKSINYSKQYRQTNKDKIAEYDKQHYQKVKTQIRQRKNQYQLNRRKNNPAIKLRHNISNIICLALNGRKNGKSMLKYIPYTIQDLKNHLESQFDSNMSWDNYGSYWQIDHIYPQSKLPYTSMEDENFKKCWSLNNLRPLEGVANRKKSNKIGGV